jgi:hypothetical protein
MSLVRISSRLIGDVAERVKETGDKVFETTVLPSCPLAVEANVDALFNVAERAAWGEYEHLRAVIPKSWVHTAPRVDVTIRGTDLPEHRISRSMECPPLTVSGYGYVDVKLEKEALPPGLLAELLAYQQQILEHRAKFTLVNNQVEMFLRSCKSLNDALKKYPDIALYVPRHYIDRVNHKDARPEAKDATAPATEHAIDRDLVTSFGVVGALHEPK